MKRITLEEYKLRIQQRFPDENFKVLEYTSLNKLAKIQCLNCGKIIIVNNAGNFLAKSKKYGCAQCQSQLLIKREQKKQELLQYYDIIKEEVKNTHIYYTVKCKKCGHIRINNLYGLYKHLKCGCETGIIRNRTSQEFLDEVNKNSKYGPYSLVGEYTNQLTKVLLRHNCGFIWSVRPNDVIRGKSQCPKCGRKRSKGEIFIENFLIQNNISFQAEKKLNNSRQRFDFYLENKKYKIAIEFNGKQHYEESSKFSTSLEIQQKRDQKKIQYCQDNNILLYIIPYNWSETQIEHCLYQIINKFND